ncbi:hypothetical protein OG500_01105 [Kitasatospora sp. NBC_01250]|uniref:hypothetical protein n=1 Tax=Kitasatospora sp. NBC_01250 TaxID=2903571 RepID=UPI002E3796EF|nr:hypothetical protein [Kitasatospora sp. NBC_01250]
MKKIKAAVAIAGVLAGVGLTAAPAEASPANCGSKQWGGQFLCGGDYGRDGQTFANLPGGNQEVFVVGTDHAVWQRWTVDSGSQMSDWNSLGGYVLSQVQVQGNPASGENFAIMAKGTDGQWWNRVHDTSGNWGPWYALGK